MSRLRQQIRSICEKRRVVNEIVLSEDADIADAFADAVAAFGPGEETAEAFGRNVGLDVFGIDGGASLDNVVLADIGAKDLNVSVVRFISQIFEQSDGDRIGFLARSAAGSPDADVSVGAAVFQIAGNTVDFSPSNTLGLRKKPVTLMSMSRYNALISDGFV